jgi:hypothetical protein
MHLFTGRDDIFLSKLDSIFDLIIYDDCLLGLDQYSTYELHGLAGVLGSFPIIFIVSFCMGELPSAYSNMVNNTINGPFGETYGPITVISVFSILFALRPFFIHKLVFNTSPFYYFSVNMLCYFFVLMVSVLFVEISANISTTKDIALIASAFSYFLFYNASVSLIRVNYHYLN